jgi:hypothetical protein
MRATLNSMTESDQRLSGASKKCWRSKFLHNADEGLVRERWRARRPNIAKILTYFAFSLKLFFWRIIIATIAGQVLF